MSSDIKKVLIIAPTPFFADRGCHVHIAEQAWALQRQGKEVLVVTYGIGRDLADIPTKRTIRFPWYRKESIGPSWHKFYVDIALFVTALRAARRFKPDIIHGHLHEGCLIGYLISRISGLGLVFDCQGSLTGELIAHNFILTRTPWLRQLWHRLERWIDHFPDVILAQSTEMLHELTTKFGVERSRVHMAYDGVNTHVFHPQPHNQQRIQQLNLPADRRLIVYLGGLTKHKGVDTLLDAFAAIHRAVPEAYLLLMGYPNEDHYRQRVHQLKLTDHVHITGKIRYEDAPQYLALGEIAIAPKRTQTEANGKIYNYMAAGLPVVAFDTVVNRDILGDLGVFVNPAADHHALATAVINLLQDAPRRHQLAQQVRAKAVAKYSWDDVAQRINRAYEQAHRPWQLQVFAVSVRKKEKWHWAKPYLQQYLTPQSRCLDVGSGVGTLSVLQERLGGHWEFTETDPDSAAQTRAIVHGPVHEIDINDETLQPGTYDLITAFDVIEHVPHPDQFLRRLAELLTPTGVALLTTPADDAGVYLWRRLADTAFGIDKAAHDHEVEGFSRAQLHQLAATANLTLHHAELFSFSFTELIELAYNAAYILKNRHHQTTRGYNVALSPASPDDVTRHQYQLALLRIVYPILRSISLLDHVVPLGKGCEWGIVLQAQSAPQPEEKTQPIIRERARAL